MKELETLATKMVGDGKSPNAFFVSNAKGKIVAIFLNQHDATDWAEATGARAVEDRKSGQIWPW